MWYSAEYLTFSISDEAGKYRLTVDGYSGDAGNALMIANDPEFVANGMMFTTPDSDNDTKEPGTCGKKGSWWYGECSISSINKNKVPLPRREGVGVSDVDGSRMLVKLN